MQDKNVSLFAVGIGKWFGKRAEEGLKVAVNQAEDHKIRVPTINYLLGSAHEVVDKVCRAI